MFESAPAELGGAITNDEIKIVLALLNATKESSDAKLGDVVQKGTDIMNESYSSVTFTNDTYFNNGLNAILEDRWSKAEKRETKEEIKKLQAKILSSLNGYFEQNTIDPNAPLTDKAIESLKKA